MLFCMVSWGDRIGPETSDAMPAMGAIKTKRTKIVENKRFSITTLQNSTATHLVLSILVM